MQLAGVGLLVGQKIAGWRAEGPDRPLYAVFFPLIGGDFLHNPGQHGLKGGGVRRGLEEAAGKLPGAEGAVVCIGDEVCIPLHADRQTHCPGRYVPPVAAAAPAQGGVLVLAAVDDIHQ